MSRTLVLCCLGLATGNEICAETPTYRIQAHAGNGKRVTLHLCSNHIHRAWQLAQAVMVQRFRDQDLRVKSIHLHQLPRASAAAEAAS